MKWIATLANFFLPGLGYLIAVPSKRVVGLFWLLGVIGLTIVEQGMGLEQALPGAFKLMFASVFIINTGHAINTWQILSAQEAEQAGTTLASSAAA